jgi:quaternary ammonium compound-resistance protein SugE
MSGMDLSWMLLLGAGLSEIGWAVGLKYSDGFTRPLATMATVVLMALSFWLLSLALRQIPLGTAYAAWTGIGTVGTVLVGMLLFGEPRSAARFACIALILAGVAGLKGLGSGH